MVGSESLLSNDDTEKVEASLVSNDLPSSMVPVERELGKHVDVESDRGLLQDVVSSLPLLTADVLGLASAFVALRLLGRALLAAPSDFALLPAVLCVQVSVFLAMGLYPACGLHAYMEFRRIARAVLITHLTLALFHVCVFEIGEAMFLAGQAVAAIVLVSAFRSVLRGSCAGKDWWMQPALVFGISSRMERELRLHPKRGLRPIRVFDLDELAAHNVRRIFASSDSLGDVEVTGLRHLRTIIDIPELRGAATVANFRDQAVELDCVDQLAIPILRSLKRCIDLIIVGFTAPITLPILAALSVCVQATTKGSVFYGQKRVGRNRKSFFAWKFRTMVPNADEVLEDYLASDPQLRDEWENTHKLRDDPRVTSVGKFLRCTSLDELPQLWNVLTGEMSLIGPRPIIDNPHYDRLYIDYHAKEFRNYCRVRPGITGLWQVMGRNHTTYEKRIELDDYYVRNWSLYLDLFILLRTIRTVLLREGAY